MKSGLTYNIFIGIDPGKEGGLAIIRRGCLELPSVEAFSFTDYDTERKQYDLLFDLVLDPSIEEHCEPFIYLEHVSSSPQMGVTSAFTFGKGFGVLTGILAASSLPHALVKPQAWQKGLAIPKRDKSETQNDFKDRLLTVAQRLFPKFPLWKQPKTLGKQRSVADALLIAEYTARTMSRKA